MGFLKLKSERVCVGVSYISSRWIWTRITAVHLPPLYYTSMTSFINILQSLHSQTITSYLSVVQYSGVVKSSTIAGHVTITGVSHNRSGNTLH